MGGQEVWNDTLLVTTPASQPVLNSGEGLTYIGDYLDLVAVGKNFYGAFCANNTPDPANFPGVTAGSANPNGAIYFRNVTAASPWNLIGSDGHSTVLASIDPFFVNVTEVPAYSDFYVRDWTDSPMPHSKTIERAICVTFSRSFAAPFVTRPKTSCSAALPASATIMKSSSSSRVSR